MSPDSSHKADGISEVGAEKQQIAPAFGDSVDDRREMLRCQRIHGLVDDSDAILLGVGLRAKNGIARECGVCGYQRHRRRPWSLLCGESKESLGERGIRIRSGWDHSEVVRIVESNVDAEAHQPDEKAPPLRYQRHCRQQRVGTVTSNDEID